MEALRQSSRIHHPVICVGAEAMQQDHVRSATRFQVVNSLAEYLDLLRFGFLRPNHGRSHNAQRNESPHVPSPYK